tara:strand:+ start:12460 stop:13401 length:942 start_codon:yes stop_codon:yes gene_type:complete
VCGKSFANNSSLNTHQKKCNVFLEKSTEGVDYIKCRICGYIGKNITSHVKKHHSLSKSEYEEKYGSTICEKTRGIYAVNGDWITRAKERGDDLSEYYSKLSDKISEGIMKSDSAREARRKNLSSLNKTKEFRDRSSKTAKKTSGRKDIQKERSERLAKWRLNNPEEFYEKCTSVMHKSWHSKPEMQLFEIINRIFPNTFKRNQQLKRKNFKTTKSNKRQIDILSLENKVLVEFDGIHHFKSVFKETKNFENTVKRDKELNEVLVEEGWTVIRVSYDEYDYKDNGTFNQETLDKVRKIISNKTRGLWLFGKSYV